LENKELSKFLTFSDQPIDFHFEKDRIFILFENRVDVYSNNGIYLKSLPFREIKDAMKIYYSKDRVYVKHNGGIDGLSFDKIQNKGEYQVRLVEDKGIQDFAVVGNTFAVLKENKILFRMAK
jgi:hypothetical protein